MLQLSCSAVRLGGLRTLRWRGRAGAPRRCFGRSTVRMMPEGPECHTLSAAMDKNLGGGKYALEGVEIISGRFASTPPEGLDELARRLPLALEAVRCKGKFIYFQMASNVSLWSTLGMSGGWTLRRSHPHCRLALSLAGGDGDRRRLLFYDMRNFGTLRVCFDDDDLRRKLASLGLSWLEDGDADDFADRFRDLAANAARRAPRKPLAKWLMDQKATAGIGNYLLSEILYATRTDPWAAVGDVGEERWAAIRGEALRLTRASRDAQAAAYEDADDPRPKLRDLEARGFALEVYGQAVARGLPVRRDVGPHGRTVHWVPEVQTGAQPGSEEALAAAAVAESRDAEPSMDWTLKRLQAACRERGLRVSGKKADLLLRLAQPGA